MRVPNYKQHFKIPLRVLVREFSLRQLPLLLLFSVRHLQNFLASQNWELLQVAELFCVHSQRSLSFLLDCSCRSKSEARSPATPLQVNWLRQLISKFPRMVLLGSIFLVAALASQAVRIEDGTLSSAVQYDFNLLNLQAKGIDSVRVQERIFDHSNSSLLYAVSLAHTAEEARTLRKQFEALPSVSMSGNLVVFPPTIGERNGSSDSKIPRPFFLST